MGAGKKSPAAQYAASAAIGAAICLAVLWGRGLFDNSDPGRVYRILSDGFFAASVLLIGAGVMTAVASAGFFDIIQYAGICFVSKFFSDVRKGKRPEDFYEYRKAKMAGRKPQWRIAIVGLAYFCVAAAFNYLYFQRGL